MIGGIGVSGSAVENDKIVAEAAGKITNIIWEIRLGIKNILKSVFIFHFCLGSGQYI